MEANELKELQELIEFLKENMIAEFELDRDGRRFGLSLSRVRAGLIWDSCAG